MAKQQKMTEDMGATVTKVKSKRANPDDKRTAWGVWLSENEKAQIDAILAKDAPGASRSKLMRLAIGYWLKQYKAGKVTLPIKKTTVIDL